MSKKKSKPAGELIPADTTPVWSVVTDEAGVHRLLYGKKLQDKAATVSGLERLRAVAAWCNKRKLVPRARIQCQADRSDTPRPLRKSLAAAESHPVAP